MARTPTSEILQTIQAVKQMQADLTTLTRIVETLGERIERLEAGLETPRRD
jgi:hypothetical protein